MLSPDTLEGVSDTLVELFADLERDILSDMARRIARLGKIDNGTQWQARMLAESTGLRRNIDALLKRYSPKVRAAIKSAVRQAYEESSATDGAALSRIARRDVSLPFGTAVEATVQKLSGDLSRLTSTTAAECQKQFVAQANRAYMQTLSGAFSYADATKIACDSLSEQGITSVLYVNSKPVTRTIEAAVRMNVITGISQSAAVKTLADCEQLGCDLVEVSAHAGARPEHEVWQGGVYSISGTSDKYPPLSVTGYGEVDGLCGVNCRHSFAPWVEGEPRHWSAGQLAKYEGEERTIDGVVMSRYEASQMQREAERKVRYWKRREAVESAGGVDSSKAAGKVSEWQNRVVDICKQAGFRRDKSREAIGGE